jgi:hypothetical protein
MEGAVSPLVAVAALVLAVGAAVFALTLSGRVRLAGMIPGGIALLAGAIFVFGSLIATGEGQAGLALFLIIVLFMAPLFAASLVAWLAGIAVLALRRRARGGP